MAKRKRGEAGEYGSSEEWQQQVEPQAQQYGASRALISTIGSNPGDVDYASSSAVGGIGAAPQESAGASALSENADSTHQWSNSSSSRYPDVPTYNQQPYYFQQTDPSTYNSPWPPADAATFGSQTASYSVSAPAPTMPYFPPHSVTESSENALDAAVVPQPSYQNYPAEIAASSQYAYVQQPGAGQGRGDASSQTPAFLYEDASMHLKIQSLPILENLV